MSELTMYDSTTAADIPEDAEAVAGYIDGRYAWSEADWARFAHATVRRRIAVNAINAGDTLDIEPGCATPEQAPGWVAKRVASGANEAELWLYMDRNTWPQVRSLVGPGFRGGYWVADWTGEPHALEGATAVQYANPPGSGGHYDLSVVTVTPPAPTPAPEEEEDEMALYATNTAGTGFVIATDLSHKEGLPDPEDAAALLETGLYKTVHLTDQLIEQIPAT